MITRIAAFTLMAASLAFAADPFVGTWKPDLEKTKYISPGPAEAQRTRYMVIESTGADSRRISYFFASGKPDMTPSGKPIVIDLVADGKERSTEGGGVRSSVRVDERHLRNTSKSSKGTTVTDVVISADGKTMTETRKGTGFNTGRPVDEFLVFTKQ